MLSSHPGPSTYFRALYSNMVLCKNHIRIQGGVIVHYLSLLPPSRPLNKQQTFTNLANLTKYSFFCVFLRPPEVLLEYKTSVKLQKLHRASKQNSSSSLKFTIKLQFFTFAAFFKLSCPSRGSSAIYYLCGCRFTSSSHTLLTNRKGRAHSSSQS